MLFKEKRIHMDDKEAITLLHAKITNNILNLNYTINDDLIVICIGTDRSTGDALGPLTGTFLKKARLYSTTILGDIDNPVHASNLDHYINIIDTNYNNPFIIAVDASLGKQSSIGYIDVKKGPLKPGTGVNKQLPEIGDMHITGLVNVGGYMEYLVLQSTRLSVVMKMARIITQALEISITSLANRYTAIE